MAYPTKNTQVVALGLSRLISRYRDGSGNPLPNIGNLLTIYLNEIQLAENMMWDVFTLRNLATGVGDQLDHIGNIVGQAREGLDDVGYRIAIGLRILANRSGGRATDIVKIAFELASLFTADTNGLVEYFEAPIMSFSVGVWNQTHPDIAAELLTEARAKSSRGVMIYSTWPFSQSFTWGSVYSAGTGFGGWGSVYSPSTGGLLSSARALI